MTKQTAQGDRFCGNCHFHGVYRYPDKIFCLFHFLRQQNPVYSTLYVCRHWKPDYQECFCVREATRHCEKVKR